MTNYSIDFNYQTDFELSDEDVYIRWVNRCIEDEGFTTGDISYFFLSDEALLEINKSEINHDYFTDIITFDLSIGNLISAEIYISVDRVRDNAKELAVSFDDEIRRVLIHGVLHCMGFKDKSEEESRVMRKKEEEKMQLFHVEQ